MPPKPQVFLLLGVLPLLRAVPAHAQDSAAAGALFDKGVAEMASGNFTTACPALEESQRIEPRAGTLFASAECHAKWGKLATAVARYEDYIGWVTRLPTDQQARHRDRVASSQQQVEKLKPTLPRLTLTLAADAPSGTIVKRNGVVFQGASLGLPLPVDPGEYVISTQAPGGAEKVTTLRIALSETKQVELEVLPAAAEPASTNAPAQSADIAARPGAPAASSSRRTLAFVIGGVGLAGIAVGAVTGGLVLSKKGDVDDNCDGGACRNQTGLDAAESGQTLATVSTIGFGVGLAGLATSAVLLLTAPKAEPEHASRGRWQPLVASHPRGVWAGLERRF